MARGKRNGAVQGGNGKKMEVEEFVLKAITTLRTEESMGIHTVFSGFNEEFRRYYGADPVAATKRLVEKGVVITRPVKGGVMIYKADEAPASALEHKRKQEAWRTILGS